MVGARLNATSPPIPVVPARIPIPAACNELEAANAAANIRTRFIGSLRYCFHLAHAHMGVEGNCARASRRCRWPPRKSRLLRLARPQDELAAQMARFTDAMCLGHLGERVLNDVRQRYGALRDQLGDAIQPAAVTIDLRPQ